MGYEGVEFYSPYFAWKPEYAKKFANCSMTKVKCYSTHNGSNPTRRGHSQGDGVEPDPRRQVHRARERGQPQGLDGWKKVADLLNAGNEKFAAAGMTPDITTTRRSLNRSTANGPSK